MFKQIFFAGVAILALGASQAMAENGSGRTVGAGATSGMSGQAENSVDTRNEVRMNDYTPAAGEESVKIRNNDRSYSAPANGGTNRTIGAGASSGLRNQAELSPGTAR